MAHLSFLVFVLLCALTLTSDRITLTLSVTSIARDSSRVLSRYDRPGMTNLFLKKESSEVQNKQITTVIDIAVQGVLINRSLVPVSLDIWGWGWVEACLTHVQGTHLWDKTIFPHITKARFAFHAHPHFPFLSPPPPLLPAPHPTAGSCIVYVVRSSQNTTRSRPFCFSLMAIAKV